MKEYGDLNKKLSGKVPWHLMRENCILMNKNGTLQKTLEIRGFDLEVQPKEIMKNYTHKLNNIMKRAEDGFTFNIDTIRKKSDKYVCGNFKEKLEKLIDKEREQYFNSGNHFENITYLTIIYTVPLDQLKKVEKLYIENNDKDYEREFVEEFLKEFNTMKDLLKGVFLDVRELTEEETLTYLHSLVSLNKQNICLPLTPIFLGNYLCDSVLKGGLQLKLETELGHEEYITPISIMGYPHLTRPCFFDDLNKLGIEYRWNIRYRALGKQKALAKLSTLWGVFYKNRYSLWQMVLQELTKKKPVTENETALKNADEIKSQETLTESDFLGQGYYTNLIILRDKDKKELDKKVRMVNELIQKMGFTTIVETYNALHAYLGSLAGDLYHNERDYCIQNSLTASHLFPLSAVWAGEKYNKHLNAPSLLYTQTNGSTPFRLNLHDGEVAHTAILGKTGGGKSVLLGTLALHFRKYNNFNVYIFDKDRSSLVLTTALGGNFYDIGEDDIGFQPLRNIDDEKEREWANQFILEILEAEKVNISSMLKKKIWKTLELLAGYPINDRTITSFSSLCDDSDVKIALEAYTIDGALGRYFDSNNDSLEVANWTVFEMAKIIDNTQVVPHLLSYLFHKIENRLNGNPTMIVLDECWMFLTNPKFASKMKDWLKTFRKKNAFIVFATQELTDIKKSSIYDTIREACVTKIFLPNKNANSEANRELYKELGLNEKEIFLLTDMTERKDYLLKQNKGTRVFDLALGEIELAFVTATDLNSQKIALKIYEEGNKDTEKFCNEWLSYKGVKLE